MKIEFEMLCDTHRTNEIRQKAVQRSCARACIASCIIFLSSFIFHPSSFAQNAPTLRASADPAEIKPGSSTTYTITLEGGQPDAAPQLQLPPGLEPASNAPSYSYQTSIINGVMKNSSVFTWIIIARQTGTLVIPPQEIHVGGKLFKSNEVRVVVNAKATQPSSQNDPLISMQIEKREIYVGEVVPITVTIYAPERRVAMQRIGLIELPKDNFAIQRFPIQAEQSVVSMGGVRNRAYTFRSTLSALKAGKFKLGPATSEIVFLVEARGGNTFQSPFFSQTEERTAKPQSSDIDITVLSLPEKDRPASFNGLVGDFEISINADPHELSVGDPISVEMTITGSGNFDSLSAPALTSAGDWKTYPARRLNIRQPDPTGETVEQRATFNQVLIPKKILTAIPPFEISFFSPTKKQYVTARTAPVPLRVKETSAPTPSRATSPLASTSGEQSPTEPEKMSQPQVKLTDIVTVLPDQAAWITPHPVLWKNRSFLFWNGAAATILFLLIGIKFGTSLWQSLAFTSATPVRRLWKKLSGDSLSRGDFYQTAAQYIRLRSGTPDAESQSILDQHERLNFSPSRTAAAEPIPADERARVLKILKS
ncbi:MAG: BatD family protein [Verrucomicrobia bacterium]|nr:BatD family protein [Verrucomicrobiota bacterium]